MEGKEPTPLENPRHKVSSSSTSPHIGDYGGGMQKSERNRHDVFLSCEEEVDEPLGNLLHSGLVNAGINTFYVMDHWSKKISPQVIECIMQSKILITIISKFYASDKACLRELVLMLECKRSSGRIVLPIFFDVTPSEVQRVEGVFKTAFSRYEHEDREDKTELEEWRKALAEVGSLTGWEIAKFRRYRYQEALIKAVVARLMSLLKRTFKLPKELVGIDDHVTDIMRSIDPKYNDTRIIGICGVCGSGKTTLAKALWNKLSGDFKHLSFVPNIREVSRRMGIEYLQEELICDILRSQHTVPNVDEGIGIMKSQFASKKIFIILDDVNDATNLDALFGDGSWLKAGSIVIITTRNNNILDKANAHTKCKLDELTPDQALTLFNRHLHGEDYPLKAYEDMSRRVISGVRRNPSILELIGSSLCRKKVWEKVWEDAFMKLKDEVNNTSVKDVLRITYESLDYEQQQIFLDIACFFIGSSKQNPTYMWDSCDFLPKKGIEVLREMSLIEIDKDDKLIMHDDQRNLGREIVFLEDEDDKRMHKLSRLWDYEKALDVLANNKGTNMIQAICLDKYDPERSYIGENFKELTNLRFLKLCGASFTGDFQNMLSELIWLHWECCPSNFVATNFHPKQLVVLDLSRSEISEDWGGWGPIKMATKLKVLNLSSCPHLKRTPNLTTFESLEILILEKCENLEEIHPSIGDNKSLISLNVSGCRRVEKLPIGVGPLEELKELLINDTNILEIPMLGNGLMKLETLSASFCGRLEELPAGVGTMEKLRELLINDTAIRGIPMSGRGLKELKILNASGCRSLEELPTRIGSMEELRELLINDTGIQEIPISGGGLSKLETLCASYCEELAQLSKSMGSLVSLTRLDLSHSGIEKLPKSMVFPKLLTRLDLSYSWIEKLPKSLGSLFLLTQLDLSHSGIREFPKIMDFSRSLTQLDLSHTGIGELPNHMYGLDKLTHLNLSYLGIKELPKSMRHLGSLQHLLLQGCYLLKHLPDLIGKLESLIELDLRSTCIAKLPDNMQDLKNLKILDIRGTNITRLPDRFSVTPPDLEISWEHM